MYGTSACMVKVTLLPTPQPPPASSFDVTGVNDPKNPPVYTARTVSKSALQVFMLTSAV